MTFLAKLFVGVLGCGSAIDVCAHAMVELIVLLTRSFLFGAMVLGPLGRRSFAVIG